VKCRDEGSGRKGREADGNNCSAKKHRAPLLRTRLTLRGRRHGGCTPRGLSAMALPASRAYLHLGIVDNISGAAALCTRCAHCSRCLSRAASEGGRWGGGRQAAGGVGGR
jgi:hypothetical protein